MAKLQDEEAIKTAKALGEHRYDWVAVKDNSFEIVCKYVSASKALEVRKIDPEDQGQIFGFLLDHVVYPSQEEVRARMVRRPLLAKTLEFAILELYGSAEEAELGKV